MDGTQPSPPVGGPDQMALRFSASTDRKKSSERGNFSLEIFKLVWCSSQEKLHVKASVILYGQRRLTLFINEVSPV